MADRAAVASSFTLIKGTLIDETYAVFARWDFELSKSANLELLREQNYIGARTGTWLRDVIFVLNRRFDPEGRDRALVLLAQGGCPPEVWRPLMLWHMTRDEFLVRDFLEGWLFEAYEQGVYRLRSVDLHDYLRGISERGGLTEHAWSESTINHAAPALLRTAMDFGLLKGTVHREFAGYHLPEQSFIYLLLAMLDAGLAPRQLISSRDWRMYLMRPDDVERELLRLHQFRKLRYEVAGSIVELSLPSKSALEYAEAMVA